MVTTSFSLMLLSLFYVLVDVAAIWNGGALRIAGDYNNMVVK